MAIIGQFVVVYRLKEDDENLLQPELVTEEILKDTTLWFQASME